VLRDFVAFEQHLVNASARLGTSVNPLHYERPGYYKGSVAGLIGHEATVRWPAYTQEMDYELELAMVIGRAGHDLDPEEAVAHLFGIACFNDFSARDIQAKEKALGMGPAKAKDFGSALGPWVTTMDEVGVEALEMRARVNGEEWSLGSTADLMWRPGELIAYASLGETLLPGDVIGTGTVGSGCGLELGRNLQPGDVVELEITAVGVLRNRVGQPEPRGWEPDPRPQWRSSSATASSGKKRLEQ